MHYYNNIDTVAQTCSIAVVDNAAGTQGVIYYRTSGGWATSKTNDTVGLITRFATFINYLFRVNGTDVIATSIAPVTGTWGTTNAPATITPKIINVYEDRVYLGNGNAANQRSRLWFSSLPSSAAITWDTTNDFVDINPDDGDELTAYKNHGDVQLIFKHRALYRWRFKNVEPDRVIGVGAPSQEAVQGHYELGITFFVNRHGAWAYTSGYPKNIGRSIQPFFDAITDANILNVKTGIDADHFYVHPGADVTVDGRTYRNPVFVYTISLDAWTIDTLYDVPRYFGSYLSSSQEVLHFGNNNGGIFQLGGMTVTTDDSNGAAAPIAGEVEFREEFLSPNQSFGKNLTTYGDNFVGLKWSYRYDRSPDWISAGEQKHRIHKLLASQRGHYVQVRVADNSRNHSIIEGYHFETKDEETKRRTYA